MAYRIHRLATPDMVVFVLSGDMGIEPATRLQKFLANEASGRVCVDLKDVTLVDRAAMHFLAGAETAGIRIINFPEYVRSWIAATWDSQSLSPPDSDQPALQP